MKLKPGSSHCFTFSLGSADALKAFCLTCLLRDLWAARGKVFIYFSPLCVLGLKPILEDCKCCSTAVPFLPNMCYSWIVSFHEHKTKEIKSGRRDLEF